MLFWRALTRVAPEHRRPAVDRAARPAGADHGVAGDEQHPARRAGRRDLADRRHRPQARPRKRPRRGAREGAAGSGDRQEEAAQHCAGA